MMIMSHDEDDLAHTPRQRRRDTAVGAVVMSGYLCKMRRTHRTLLSAWNKRWFVIQNNCFCWAKCSSASKLSGSVPIATIRRVRKFEDGEQDVFSFIVEAEERSFMLRTDTRSDMSRWINQLELQRELVHKHNTPQERRKRLRKRCSPQQNRGLQELSGRVESLVQMIDEVERSLDTSEATPRSVRAPHNHSTFPLFDRAHRPAARTCSASVTTSTASTATTASMSIEHNESPVVPFAVHHSESRAHGACQPRAALGFLQVGGAPQSSWNKQADYLVGGKSDAVSDEEAVGSPQTAADRFEPVSSAVDFVSPTAVTDTFFEANINTNNWLAEDHDEADDAAHPFGLHPAPAAPSAAAPAAAAATTDFRVCHPEVTRASTSTMGGSGHTVIYDDEHDIAERAMVAGTPRSAWKR